MSVLQNRATSSSLRCRADPCNEQLRETPTRHGQMEGGGSEIWEAWCRPVGLQCQPQTLRMCNRDSQQPEDGQPRDGLWAAVRRKASSLSAAPLKALARAPWRNRARRPPYSSTSSTVAPGPGSPTSMRGACQGALYWKPPNCSSRKVSSQTEPKRPRLPSVSTKDARHPNLRQGLG